MSFKILIVDDRPENIFALAESLADIDAEFTFANSGYEALKILTEDQDFGLALIDVQMPDMSGFELVRLMRGVEKTKYIPIIFVTANPHSADIEFTGYHMGAVDFIFKPININVLKSKIGVFKNLKDKQMILDQKVQELEAATKELEISRAKAIEADHTKSTFLANMSHEIRTPMTALIGFAELLKNEGLNEKVRREYVDVIIRNGQNLIELVNEVLDLSKIEAGQLNLDFTSTQLNTCIDDIVKLLSPLSEKNKVQLTLKIDEDVPSSILTDPLRFRQIITNLVSNGIKFSGGGKVFIHVTGKKESKDKKLIKISVQDNGIGIASEKQHLLFKPFVQLNNNSFSESIMGTGLGLCLSKMLAVLLGGDLVLEKSVPGKGSTFCLELPSEEVPLAKNDPKGQFSHLKEIKMDSLKDLDLLVADDSLDNQMLIKTVLSQYGANVLLSGSGDEAVNMALTNKIDAVLMDYKMPGLDGFGATQRLREQGFNHPIILLTANAMRGEKEKAIAIGADAYVSKPIDWNILIRQILTLTC